jgi:hypothetical protein
VTKQLFSFHTNQRLLEAFSEANVPFLVIGGLAVHFHVRERVADDLDLVVAPTEEAGRRLLVTLAAVGHPGHFTLEEYAQHSRPAGFPLKNEFYADIFKAEPWFDFAEHWNEAHDALVFNTPVKVASIRALLLRLSRLDDPEQKRLRDMELLRRAALR